MTALGLILLGILILASSIKPAYSLIGLLPTGNVRQYWQLLMLMIMVFIAGYVGYAAFFWEHLLSNQLRDLIVPAVFFFGSCFVWVTGTLFHRTAIDLRRMALLEEESITDPLLGIYNRRYMDRRLATEIGRAKRYGLPLSVLMVDIDHFKKVNDVYGHQAGDLVLGYVGELILGVIRDADIAARYGGEEIVIIAPDSTAKAGRELAERLRNNIGSHELVLSSESRAKQAVRVFVSIGVAELDEQTSTAQQLIENADAALYEAKETGRNRVKTYKPPQAGQLQPAHSQI